MNKLVLLFLCFIVPNTSAELLVKDSNGNYILSFNPIPIIYGTEKACPPNMDKMVSGGITLCVPSTYNEDCSIQADDVSKTKTLRPDGCLTLHPDDCGNSGAIDFIFFTDEQITSLGIPDTSPLRQLKVCVVDPSNCPNVPDSNEFWKHVTDATTNCPVPIGDIPCEVGYIGFDSGIAKCVSCPDGSCPCPSDESHNIPTTCKINLEKGTCASGYYKVDDRNGKEHHDIYCREQSSSTDCTAINGIPAHCNPYDGDANSCAYFPGFYYTYGTGTSQESKRCCPDPEEYMNAQGLTTMDHIPGGCPAPVDQPNNLIMNNDERQPCEERDQTSVLHKRTICCPFVGVKKIPAGCKVDTTIGGACRDTFDPTIDMCVSVGSSSATNAISSATTSQQLLDANIPLETLEAAFEGKGGVVLDADTTTAQLGVVSADKLKTAYQSKPGSCS